MTFVVIAAYCVLCKVRNQCHRWFDITQILLHCNNSLIQSRSQQCHHNALFVFSIVHFHRSLIGRNSGHIPLQIWTQLRPSVKSLFVRSWQLLSDSKCGFVVSILWPSTLFCVARGFHSSIKCISMEYIRVMFLSTLLVVPCHNTTGYYTYRHTKYQKQTPITFLFVFHYNRII